MSNLNEPLKCDATVLIVDDNSDVRAFLGELVSSIGARFHEASDGLEALLSIQSIQPDLILLDVEMPRLNGIEVCKRLKSNPATFRLPVIIITSLSALADRVAGIEAGADDFLSKPIQPSEFIARVKSLLRLKRLYDSLESAEGVIFTLARAIEAKDMYTQGHTERVTAYSLELGRTVGLSEEDLISLRQGGTLHDIGKIGTPDKILNKPGKLTADEFETIRQHPLIGFKICSPLKSLARSLPCIRWHHEKPNGKGYPDGLKGSEIPPLARILAIADVYDALTSKRPYKETLPPAVAVRILIEEAGTGGLDEPLVRTFVKEVLSGFSLD